MNQNQLLNWISMLGFCEDDIELYLDTHPNDQAALEYRDQCVDLLKNAKKDYEKEYGPLNTESTVPMDSWKWVETPMPWEGGRK